MKKLILLITLLPVFCFSQTAKELEREMKKSYYYKLVKFDTEHASKKYHCLIKNYNIDYKHEKEFMNKKDFFTKYPDWKLKDNNDIIFRSIIEESIQKMHYENNGDHSIFPKCFEPIIFD